MTDSAIHGDTGILAGYLSEDELASELGVTRATIRNWKAQGEAPAVTRIGKKIYYSRSDVRDWLQSCRVEM